MMRIWRSLRWTVETLVRATHFDLPLYSVQRSSSGASGFICGTDVRMVFRQWFGKDTELQLENLLPGYFYWLFASGNGEKQM